MKRLLSYMPMLLICSISIAQDAQSLLQANNRDFFIENKGQWPEEVKYLEAWPKTHRFLALNF